MRADRDHASLSPDQRFQEVTSLLARGLRALRDRAALPTPSAPENAPESDQDGLEVSRDIRLSVHRG